jgi:hypothetical protein
VLVGNELEETPVGEAVKAVQPRGLGDGYDKVGLVTDIVDGVPATVAGEPEVDGSGFSLLELMHRERWL